MNAIDSQASPLQDGRARLGLVAVLTAGALLTGCMTAKVDETRQTNAAIHPHEAIVVLKRPQLEGLGTEEEFLTCVQNKLGGELTHPDKGQHAAKAPTTADAVPFKIYGEQQFLDAMFPWFESSTAPANAAGLKVLMQRPGIADRLQQIGVRYIVWLDGQTRTADSKGSIACAVGPGGGGCFGLGWWDKKSGYVASVWDTSTATEIGSVSTDVSGTNVLIGAILPIPIMPPVQHTACARLSQQLHSFLVGGDLAPAPEMAGRAVASSL